MGSRMHGLARRLLKTRALLWMLAGVFALGVAWHYTGVCRYSKSRDRGILWGWDNNFYYAWGRSLAVDGDIDFRNDFEYLARLRGAGPTGEAFVHYLKVERPTVTGRLPNMYGIGMGVLAVPALWLARAAAALHASWTGRAVSPFAAVYVLTFTCAMMGAGLCGVAAAFRILAPRFGRRDALAAVLAGTLGTSLVYYIWFEPTMAHGAGFCFNTLLAAAAVAWDRRLGRALYVQAEARTPNSGERAGLAGPALLMGALLGFAMAIRYTNLVFALVPAMLAVARWHGLAPAARGRWRALCAASLGLAIAGSLAGFFPQMLAWKKIYGSWLTYVYPHSQMHPWPAHAPYVLFGLRRGLFIWAPLALLACAGLIRGARRGSGAALAGLAVLLATVWLYGGWDIYTLGGSYGMRGFVDASFFFMLGLAEVLHWARRARPMLRRGIAVVIVVLVLWNGCLITAYRAWVKPEDRIPMPQEIAARWPAWKKQFVKDYDLPARLRERHFPLFTPLKKDE